MYFSENELSAFCFYCRSFLILFLSSVAFGTDLYFPSHLVSSLCLFTGMSPGLAMSPDLGMPLRARLSLARMPIAPSIDNLVIWQSPKKVLFFGEHSLCLSDPRDSKLVASSRISRFGFLCPLSNSGARLRRKCLTEGISVGLGIINLFGSRAPSAVELDYQDILNFSGREPGDKETPSEVRRERRSINKSIHGWGIPYCSSCPSATIRFDEALRSCVQCLICKSVV